MTAKIQGKKTFLDGQTIYLIGWIKAWEFKKFYDDYREDAFVYQWSDQQRAHFAMRKAIKHYLPDLWSWLSENEASTTCWIDPKIFDLVPVPHSGAQHSDMGYDWGIGFRANDPLEPWFVMRWS